MLDRFRNPFIEHQWLSITMQYSSKMCLRNVPVIINYIERFKKIPSLMSLGFAAHILFMKPVETNAGKHYGEIENKKYLINDDNASYYADVWKNNKAEDVVKKILSNDELWKTDLTKINGFANAVIDNLYLLMNNKTEKIIQAFINKDLEKEKP